ncbi:MAG: hypothetical protein NTX25_04410 [Proteobacteria bacterium]|nr:hypothetical protein [Pseudomonadota bacterium]
MQPKLLYQLLWLLAMFFISQEMSAKNAGTKPQEAKTNRDPSEEKAQRNRSGYAIILDSSFPHPFELGLAHIRPKELSHAVSLGYFKRDIAAGHGVRDITIELQNFEYRYRIEPWQQHPLFMQISAGYQQIQVEGTRAVTVEKNDISFTTDIHGQLRVRSLYYTPKVGLTKHFTNGLSLSWGFGYLVPALVTAEFKSQIPGDPLLDELFQQIGSYQNTKHELERVGKRVGQVGIPHIDLLEMAYRF